MAPRNTRVTPDNQVRSPARSFVQSLDNFYAPSRDRRGEESVQRGLNAFSNIVGERAAQMKQEQRSNEFNQGVLDAMREEAGQELEGVKTGSIFRQHSKYYTAGLQETKGKAAASKFKQNFALAYEEWSGKNEDPDGSMFREFMNEQIGTFIGGLGDNEYAVSGALPIINEVATNYATQHTAFINQRLEEESWQAYDDIVAGVFDGYASGEYDMDAVVDKLAFEADDMYISEGPAANDRLVEAAIKYANTHNDPDALLALARGHDAGKIKLSVSNQEKIANAVDAVEADIQRNLSRDNARTDAEEKARRRAQLDAWGQALQEDPYAPMPSWQEVGDYTTYTQMQTLAKTFQDAGTVENPTITAARRMRFEADLFEASSTADKIRTLSDFAQANPGSLSASDISKYTKEILETSDPNSIVNNPVVGKFRDGFGQMLGSFQTDEYNIDTVSVLKTYGQRYFDEYMMSVAGDLDVANVPALRSAIKEAEAYATEQLTYQFPDIMQERNDAKPAEGAGLGVPQALDNRQAEIDRVAAEEFARLAGVPSPTGEATQEGQPEAGIQIPVGGVEGIDGVQVGADGVTLSTPEAAPEDDPEFYDAISTDDPETIRNQPDTFYQQLIQRLTDGKDLRSQASPEVLIETAKRVFGADENAQRGMLREFFREGGVNNLDPSKTAWCAGFVNAVLGQNGMTGTGSLMARSFLNWGINTDGNPVEGDVVVLSRGNPDGPSGHVGLFQGFDANGNIRVLGGNQGNKVSISTYPASKLLGFRRPLSNGGSTEATIQALSNN